MRRPLDWPLMIAQLEQSGIDLNKISRKTGIGIQTLAKTRNESRPPPSHWNEALELLDLHLKTFGTPTPRVGDYDEEFCETKIQKRYNRAKKGAAHELAVSRVF